MQHGPPSSPQRYTRFQDRQRSSLCRGGYASFTTSMTTGIIWHPQVTVMQRQQFAGAVDAAKQYKGAIDAISSICREGIRTQYRGIGPRQCQSPQAAIQWTCYEMFKDVVANRHVSKTDAIKYGILFCGSRALVTSIKCPFEIVKERMQVEGSISQYILKERRWYQHVQLIIQQDGIRGQYSGLHANIMRDLPMACLMMSGNDFYTHLLRSGTPYGFGTKYFAEERKNVSHGKRQPHTVSAGAGALSGLTATLLTQPLDVAKTVMQTQSLSRLQPGSPQPKYHGQFHCMQVLIAERGFSFLYTGTITRAIHVTLGGAVYLMIYRHTQKFFVQQFPSFLLPSACPVRERRRNG